MSKILLHTIDNKGFNPTNGSKNIVEKIEYVCSECRHLVGKTDKYCWQCGKEMIPPEVEEHHNSGLVLSSTDFQTKLARMKG